MKDNIKLPKSLRIFIRRKKVKIRRSYGKNSTQEQELLVMAGEIRNRKKSLFLNFDKKEKI